MVYLHQLIVNFLILILDFIIRTACRLRTYLLSYHFCSMYDSFYILCSISLKIGVAIHGFLEAFFDLYNVDRTSTQSPFLFFNFPNKSLNFIVFQTLIIFGIRQLFKVHSNSVSYILFGLVKFFLQELIFVPVI